MNKPDHFKEQPERHAKRLKDYFSGYTHGIVAYSGGADSALLAFAAHSVLDQQMVAVLADSPSLSRREYNGALNFAKNHQIPLHVVRTREMKNPAYRANPANRCYFCKKALFERIEELRQSLSNPEDISTWPVFYGANVDDLDDFRPGMQAASEASILAPYIELGFNKRTVRAICTYFGLEIAKKPAMPCMASRIVYGQTVTSEKLSQIEQAETFLYKLGFEVLRVRHHGDIARIEVPPQEFQTIVKHCDEISRRFRELGFAYVSLDLNGFKSGSLNAALKSTITRGENVS